MLGTLKIILVIFIKAPFSLVYGRSKFMLYFEVTGDSLTSELCKKAY